MITDKIRERLPTPSALRKAYPSTAAIADFVDSSRQTIRRIIHGQDPRLLLVMGPCSIHNISAALEYAKRLAILQEEVKEQFFIVMRAYLEKPRTCLGWKGLLNDPHLDQSYQTGTGLEWARSLFLEISGMGVPIATEFLDPVFSPYLEEFVSWGAVGARTVASQIHRQLASALSMPVGFKNGLYGNIEMAVDAILSGKSPHSLPCIDQDGRPALVFSSGNPDCHLILRGGETSTNFDAQSIHEALRVLKERGLSSRVMVDCSHGNCRRDHNLQEDAFANVVEQIADGTSDICALMLESFLEEGKQSLEYGAANPNLEAYRSITDPCLGWEQSERIVKAASVRLENSSSLALV